ncbi:hypothetical protein [Polaromonas sp. CF318]|uniref:hypothetical protein n=1 Tax=Polaromonas sp. CF318 TaxID=1144318 RepID=UPI0012F88555|nr:hypothetical protein [Polaromonas sp. CF318]
MPASHYLSSIGKAATVTIAGAAAVVVSLLAALYAVMLCGSALGGTAIGVVFGLVALAMLVALGYGFWRLSWPLRALVGIALLAGSFLLLPRPTCAAKPQATIDCQ